MSNVIQIIDAISKLTEGELAVLQQVISAINTKVQATNDTAELALAWSKYTLKTQRNPNALLLEPNVQTVDGYPIIFGNSNSDQISPRSTTFAFGAKAFLGYENDANGSTYIDTDYIGNTPHDLSAIEVVNYRTMMAAIAGNSTNLSETYIAKAGDISSLGSIHTFGSIFFRGNAEKSYYGISATDAALNPSVLPGLEIQNRNSMVAYSAPLVHTHLGPDVSYKDGSKYWKLSVVGGVLTQSLVN